VRTAVGCVLLQQYICAAATAPHSSYSLLIISHINLCLIKISYWRRKLYFCSRQNLTANWTENVITP